MKVIAEAIARIGYGYGSESTSRLGLWGQEQSGRSGYWRLFFYQMQEEALRELDEENQPEVEASPKITVVPQKKPQKAPNKPRKAIRHQDEDLPAIPVPLTRIETFDSVPYLAKVWQFTSEFRLARLTSRIKIDLTSVDEEAVDEEEDVLLLLLAA